MRRTILITAAEVEKFKQRARKLKRANGITHNEALDEAAKAVGFDHWHHVAESAKTFAPTEHAHHFGVIIALDIKDAQDFHDPSGQFVEDDLAFSLCASDIYVRVREADGDDDIDPNDPTYKEDLNEWMLDGLMNYVFFRYTNPELPASVEEVVKLATEHCYWPPEYIWYKGVMSDCPDGSELADGRIIHRFE